MAFRDRLGNNLADKWMCQAKSKSILDVKGQKWVFFRVLHKLSFLDGFLNYLAEKLIRHLQEFGLHNQGQGHTKRSKVKKLVFFMSAPQLQL